jgi:hypothetical protein
VPHSVVFSIKHAYVSKKRTYHSQHQKEIETTDLAFPVNHTQSQLCREVCRKFA